MGKDLGAVKKVVGNATKDAAKDLATDLAKDVAKGMAKQQPLRRGGEKSNSSQFVSQKVVNRYEQRFGSESTQKRFGNEATSKRVEKSYQNTTIKPSASEVNISEDNSNSTKEENRIAAAEERRNKIEKSKLNLEKEEFSHHNEPYEQHEVKDKSHEIDKRSQIITDKFVYMIISLSIVVDIIPWALFLIWGYGYASAAFLGIRLIANTALCVFLYKKLKYYFLKKNIFLIVPLIILKSMPYGELIPLYSGSILYTSMLHGADEKDPTGEKRQEAKIKRLKVKQEKFKAKQEILNDVNKRVATTSSGKMLIALMVAVIWDVADIIISIFTGSADELTFDGFGIIDTALNFGIAKLSGIYYNKLDLLEYLPYLDWLPIYSISAGISFFKYRKDVKIANGASEGVKKAQGSVDKAKNAVDKVKSKFNINLNTAQSSKFKNAAIVIILILLLASIGLFFFTEQGPRWVNQVREKWNEGHEGFNFTKVFNDIQGFGLKVTNSIKTRFTKQVKIASGEYDDFSGAVDKVKKDIGLKLDVDKGTKEFIVGSSPTIYSTLTGRGLDPKICSLIGEECDLNQNIELSCSSGFGGLAGIMNPSEITFNEIEDSYYDVACSFEQGVLDEVYKKKTTTIYETVNFDFITLGYQRVDFIDADKKRELEREGEKFENYKPVYTPGPVEIAFKKITNYPLLVDDKRVFEFKFYIKNKGLGSIKKFKKISFGLPKGVKLITCSIPYTETSISYSDTGNGFEIDPALFEDRKYILIGPGKQVEFTCSLDLSSPEILNLNSPFTTDSFNVLADYEYRLIKKIPIKIKKPEYITTLTDCSTVCDNIVGCECTGECSTNLFISKGQSCDLTTKEEVASNKETSPKEENT